VIKKKINSEDAQIVKQLESLSNQVRTLEKEKLKLEEEIRKKDATSILSEENQKIRF